MVQHIAFVEHMRHHESSPREWEWQETWAGLLVLRLYHLWQLEPGTAARDAPGAKAVRALVEGLPGPAAGKTGLIRILDALQANDSEPLATVASFLRDYASVLAARAEWHLADDVYQTAGEPCPRLERNVERRNPTAHRDTRARPSGSAPAGG